MIDWQRAQELQSRYLLTRDPDALACIKSMVEKRARECAGGRGMAPDSLDELADACAVRFIEMYLKVPGWKCENFGKRIWHEVMYYLHGDRPGTLRRIEKNEVGEIPEAVTMPEPVESESTADSMGDIIGSQPYWRNVVIDCYKAKTYKGFVLAISAYCGRRWIYDHAARLHHLYKQTRRSNV